MTTAYLLAIVTALFFGAVLSIATFAILRRLVLPGLNQPRFSPVATSLDLIGAVLILIFSFELLDAHFSSGGLSAYLMIYVRAVVATLGIAGLFILALLGLILRFVLRLPLVILAPRSAF